MQKLPRVGGGGGGHPPPTPSPRSGASRPRLLSPSNIVDNLAPPPPPGKKILRTALGSVAPLKFSNSHFWVKKRSNIRVKLLDFRAGAGANIGARDLSPLNETDPVRLC